MRDGRYVPMQADFGNQPPENRKFLIVLQYYDGDMAEAEDLANIIADLERVRNKDADILLYARHDARPFPSHVISKLESKFEKVHQGVCRSRDGTTYPFAPNCMFYDLVTLLGQYPQWNQPYYAFINLETDAVPVHPGWIRELILEFKISEIHGKKCIGHMDLQHATPHMNGLAVYPIDMFFKVPGGALAGGNLAIAYDLYHAKSILPLAYDTPLIMMEYRRPTITAADLFKAHKGGIEPALYHGVKDSSAREAVKARYITFSEKKDLSRATVFTYVDGQPDSELVRVLDLWKQAWASRGWNPVILRRMDAAKNLRFLAMSKALERLPCAGSKDEQAEGFYRWLALETVGGGLLVKPDEIPNVFMPDKLTDDMKLDGIPLSALIGMMIDYTITPDDFSVSDQTLLNACKVKFGYTVLDYGVKGYKSAQVVSFNDLAIAGSSARGKRKSDVMRSYLEGA